MGQAFVVWGENQCVYGGNLKERDRLEDLGLSARIIFNWTLRKYDVRSRGLAQDRFKTGAPANVVTNLRGPQN